jgi:hypothetical protein
MVFENIVCFPSIEWSHNWERQQELISRLANHYNEIPIHIFEPLGLINHNLVSLTNKIRKRFVERSEIGSVYNNKKTQNMNFHVLNFVPFHYNSVVDSFNYNLLRNVIDTRESLVWATYLNGFTLKAFKNGKIRVLDLATRRQVSNEISEKAKEVEIEGVKISDLVFVDNYNTYLDYEKYAKKIIYLPQGVDEKVFAENKSAEEYIHLKKSGKRIIGYCGTMHKFIDYDLMFDIIKDFPQHIFMFVGNILDQRAEQLLNLSNVIFTGQKDHSSLGEYYRLFDVGLIPYTIEPYTTGVFPTKFFEYIINEVPVVSSSLPDLLRFENLEFLSIYNSKDEFKKCIEKSLNTDFEIYKPEMHKFTLENTWTKRFDRIRVEFDKL